MCQPAPMAPTSPAYFPLRAVQGFEGFPLFQQTAPLAPDHLAVTANNQERRRDVSPVVATQLVRNGIPDVQLEKLNLIADFSFE